MEHERRCYLFRKDASYLITGGASGFGLEVAKWMATHGAGHIVLMSRSGPRDEESKAGVARIATLGAKVTDARGDVTSLDDVKRVVAQIESDGHPPLAGVIHGAMVLRDEFIADLDDAQFQTVLRPKMNGAWNLHLETRDLPLEHFICFSSFSAVIGAPKQSNYNSGNVFLEGLAHHRRSQGLAALTINWGALSGAGFVARNEKTAAYLDAIGMKSINVEEALRVIRRMLQHESPQVLASRADWRLWNRAIAYVGESNTFESVSKEQGDEAAGGSIGPRVMAAAPEARAPMIRDFVAENMAAVCSIDAEGIDFDTPLTSLGLDSLMAVELMNRIEGDIGLSVPMGKVLAGPSIRELADIMLEMMIGTSDGEESEGGQSASSGATLAPLEHSPMADVFELSSTQQMLWDQHSQQPKSTAHQVVFATHVNPQLDADVLAIAVREVVAAHPMLRATFTQKPNEPVRQRFSADIACELHEANGIKADDLPEIVSQRSNRPFELGVAAARFELIRTKNAGDVLLFACHEIVADKRSATIVIDDLLACYTRAMAGEIAELHKPEFSFQDFASWERDFLPSDAAKRSYEYLRNQLAGVPAQLALGKGTVDVASGNGSPASHATAKSLNRFEFSPAISQRLLALAAEQETSLHKTLLTAYELLLHAKLGERDLVVGCQLPGRRHVELGNVVGPLDNTTVVRSSLINDPTFIECLEQVGERVDWALHHQQYPLLKTLERMDVPSDLPVPFRFEMEPETSLDPRGLPVFLLGQSGHKFYAGETTFESLNIESHGNGAQLTLAVEESGGQVFGTWRFDSRTIDTATAKGLNEAFHALIEQILNDPLTPVSTLHVPGALPLDEWRSGADHASTIKPLADDVDPVVEARLDESIQCDDPTYDFQKCEHIFLTGGTGFVGAYLIEKLLEHTSAQLHCLVRADDMQHGHGRLLANLKKYGLDVGDRSDRLHAVVGDLTQQKLGIASDEFDRLCHQIDVVYHNGADVNLAGNYANLRDVNVNGTHECLRLAITHRLKPTHVVSSYSVHASHDKEPNAVVSDSDPLPQFARLQNGYAKTKWVCESMIDEARRRGLPASIYRPGNITGHSVTGAANTNDIMHTLMLGMMHVGNVPDSDMKIDLTPVDYVAQAIVHISRQEQSLGQEFNLLNAGPLRLKMMAEWLKASDMPIGVVSLPEWRAALAELANSVPAEVLGLLSEVLTEEGGDEDDDFVPPAFLLEFSCEKTLAALKGSGITCHPVNTQLLDTYRANLDKVGFFDLVGDGAN